MSAGSVDVQFGRYTGAFERHIGLGAVFGGQFVVVRVNEEGKGGWAMARQFY